MMIAAAFVAIGFTACDNDDDDTVANASFTGTWKIIENVNLTTTVTTPDVIVDTETPATPVSLVFNEDGSGLINYTALVEEPYDEDGDDVYDGVELVEQNLQGALTYTATAGENGLTDLVIDLQATEQYKEVTVNAKYSIKGDVMYLYLKYPQSPDVLRKQ